MPTYQEAELSLDGGAPYELYRFVTPSKSFYYTSDAIQHNFDNNTYLPIEGLKRTEIKITTHEDADSNFSIEMPLAVELARAYALAITPPSLKLTIFRFHRGATGHAIYWNGDINSVTTRGQRCTFTATSDFGVIMTSSLPTLSIQPPCNNVLFDNRCKVSRSANSHASTVTASSDNNISLANIGSFGPTWFVGGEMVFGAERRSIVAQDGLDFTINYPFAIQPVNGDGVGVAAGCDHSFNGAGGCPKFANQKNYGGFPYVPGEDNNIFAVGI